MLSLNDATGGRGGAGGPTGAGGSGGDGSGGAVYNAGPFSSPFAPLPAGSLSLTNDLVTLNLATGGSGGRGAPNGSVGQGIGGGLYLTPGGTSTATSTLVILNVASTSDPNIFGTLV